MPKNKGRKMNLKSEGRKAFTFFLQGIVGINLFTTFAVRFGDGRSLTLKAGIAQLARARDL